MDQEIRFCTAPDGVQLAYSIVGKGTPIVRTGNWLTHLDYDLKSPVFRHFVLGLAERHQLLRYDSRGTGLSQRGVDEISFERWVGDIETVVDAAGLNRFILLGLSQGVSTAIAYAVRHPERVSHLILYGGYARGSLQRGDAQKAQENLALSAAMIREGWGKESESYRMFFTSQFIPGGSAEQYRWFNELELVSATPEMAERFVKELAKTNVVQLLPQVKVPTLVLHCRGDARVPFSESQMIAAAIPGAKFVPLEGKNHIFLANEPAHRAFLNAVASFLGEPPFKGPLPGSASVNERLDDSLKRIEQSWITKIVVLIAAITGVVLFGVEVWRMLQH
jgi:pimeloyl-ACP methyl ester carboxylesterase